MSKSEGREGGEEGFAALRLPFGVTMSFAAVGTARFAIAQLVLQNHREHDMVPFGLEHFVVVGWRVSAGKAGKVRILGKVGKVGKVVNC